MSNGHKKSRQHNVGGFCFVSKRQERVGLNRFS